ncbi:MerR HTH family regulatory protein [Roseovarius tolerans]|uniref:MerR HTH family regulatory protein n=1 Tax=Roseovarius tolerans TaxID=74031 RepID=A0A1H8B648_9RHOB|nr:MerR family transcriptional regulator [Roseovarius tolerans]SEM78226.1 MerR HTH family regulatory protein [Roseovarius tolerans]
MAKSADAFRTISEVAEWLEVPAHVLRFWESKFTQVKPVKRAGGRRYYRPADMRLLGGIKILLHDEGMTIKGVQKILREEGVQHVAALSRGLGGESSDQALDIAATPEPQPPAQVLSFERPTESASAKDTLGITADEPQQPETKPEEHAPSDNQADEEDVAAAEATTDDASEPADADAAQGADDPMPNMFADDTTSPEPPPIYGNEQGSEPRPSAESENLFTASGNASAPQDSADEPPATLAPLPALPDDPSDSTPSPAGALASLATLKRPVSSDLAAELAGLATRLRRSGTSKGTNGAGKD